MAKETKKADFQITIGLQNALRLNPNIKKVYFSEEGDHYFKAHEVEIHEVDQVENRSTGIKKVMALPGVKQAPIKIARIVNRRTVWQDKLVNVSYEPVAAEFTREEILKAPAVTDKKSEAEKLEILRQAAEIAKGDDIQGLLDKINADKK